MGKLYFCVFGTFDISAKASKANFYKILSQVLSHALAFAPNIILTLILP